MKVTILGCGTSHGVPRIGNVWGRCDPNNPKNRRRRVSILVEEGATRILVDTSPDLREQLLDAHVDSLDAVLYTHDHADHCHGIDDLRGVFHCMGRPVALHADARTLAVLEHRFDYVFKGVLGYPAIARPHVLEVGRPLRIGDIEVQSFWQDHGPIQSVGYRFGAIAYSTDLNGIPKASEEYLRDLELWIVDALRTDPHPTHPHLDMTLEWIARFRPKRAVLTHMAWDLDYETLKDSLPAGVEPGYDGMTIEICSN
ncbi:MAG: MBL fold metallo-hydrolase [Pseudomonadota bacterium]